MKKAIRFLTLIAVIAMSAATFASTKAQTKVKVNMLGRGGSEAENKRLNEIIADFNKSQNEIEASYTPAAEYDQTLQNQLASGEPADVIWVGGEQFLNLIKSDALQPIGDKLTDPDDFYPSLKDVFSYNGQFYCPAKDFSVLALQINKDMFDKAGVKAPTTWDELKDAAKKLTTPKVAGIVLSPAFDRFGAFLYQAGGAVTDKDFTKMTINDKAGLDAIKFYTSLYTEGYAKTPTDLGAGWGGEAFGKEQAAIATEGNWVVPYLKDQFPKVKYESIQMPAGPAGKASLAFTVCYAVPKKAKNPAQAVKFIDYLVGKEGMTKWTDLGFLPTRKSLSADWVKKFPEYKVYLDSAEFARKWQFVPGFNLVSDKANEQLQLVFSKQAKAEDALKTIEKAGNDVLAKAQPAATPAK